VFIVAGIGWEARARANIGAIVGRGWKAGANVNVRAIVERGWEVGKDNAGTLAEGCTDAYAHAFATAESMSWFQGTVAQSELSFTCSAQVLSSSTSRRGDVQDKRSKTSLD
jgi:hypothetical protein